MCSAVVYNGVTPQVTRCVTVLLRCMLSQQSYFKFQLMTGALSRLKTLSWVAEQASFLQSAIHWFSQGPCLLRALTAGASRAVLDWCAVFAVGWTLCSPHLRITGQALTYLCMQLISCSGNKKLWGNKELCSASLVYFPFPSCTVISHWCLESFFLLHIEQELHLSKHNKLPAGKIHAHFSNHLHSYVNRDRFKRFVTHSCIKMEYS